MELMITPIGLATFVLIVVGLVYFSSRLPLGAISLPCLAALTGMIYFFIMPTLSLAGGNYEFFGMLLTSLEGVHWVVFLYLSGAFVACGFGMRHLLVNPAVPRANERQLNPIALYIFLAIGVAGALLLIVLGNFNLLGDQDYQVSDGNNLLFLYMAFSMLIPLTVVVLVYDNFGIRSMAVFVVVLLVLTQVAFRYRIVLLIATAMGAFVLTRQIKVRALYVIPGTVAALMFANAFGMARKYGSGLSLSALDGLSWRDLLTGFGGEIGPLFVLASVTERPIPDWAMFDPWIVGFLRMVPSSIWPDKPKADYYGDIYYAFTTPGVEYAGVASTQHVEVLLQFGWFGVPFLSCLYFLAAIYLVSRLNLQAREVRLAGYCLVPTFFGFYMQTRGYFFQVFSDGVFMFGPLFYMSHARRRRIDPATLARADKLTMPSSERFPR